MKLAQVRFTEIRALYERLHPDGHWFDDSTIAFFRTELPEYGYELPSGRFFITAETSPGGARKFTVRKQDVATGEIDTVGEFHSYDDRAAASAAIRAIARSAGGAS